MHEVLPTDWGLSEELVEDLNRRTKDTMEFRSSSDSHLRTTLITSNLYYEERAGEWEPQDLSFALSSGNHVATKHWFNTTVSDTGISIATKEGTGVQWLVPRPTVTGGRAQLVGSGVVWTWDVGSRRLKLSGLVTAPQGKRTYSFPYTMFGQGDDFSIVDGAAVAGDIRVAAPVIFGANNETYVTSGWQKVLGTLEVTFDDRVLPDEAYPYVIDPTTTLQPDSAGLDTRIRDNTPTSNFGTLDLPDVGDRNSGSSVKHRTLLEFDVSSIDAGHTVTSATVSLYEQAAEDTASNTNWAVEFRRVLADWVEAETTWNIFKTGSNWPGSAGCSTNGTDRIATVSATVTMDGTAAGAFIDWTGDLLDTDVQNFIDGGQSNYGWLISAESVENQGAARSGNEFRSSDHATSATRPKLVVVHTSPFTPRAIMF